MGRSVGHCLDRLILPSGADLDSTLAVAQFLHPRSVILPQIAKSGASLSAAQVRAALPGVRIWTATEGSELTLSASDGRCPARLAVSTRIDSATRRSTGSSAGRGLNADARRSQTHYNSATKGVA